MLSASRPVRFLRDEIRQINLPISQQLIRRSFLALNGTYQTALRALEAGIACHAAGGTHHARYSGGSGFCVFNDLAFTAVNLIEHGIVNNVLILDLDVHQGDGTIDICNGRRGIYTCSLHCEDNFPFEKRQGSRDVPLRSHLEDAAYLEQLHRTLNDVSGEFTPDLVLYDAGVDVFEGDQLGNLDITLDGIFERDCSVLEYFKTRCIPVATVIGGGYSQVDVEIAKPAPVDLSCSNCCVLTVGIQPRSLKVHRALGLAQDCRKAFWHTVTTPSLFPHRTTGHPFRGMSVSVRLDGALTWIGHVR